MLFFIGPLVCFIVTAFAYISIFERGKVKQSLGAGGVGALFGAFIFMFMVPMIATSGFQKVETYGVDGPVNVVNGQYILKTTDGASWVLDSHTPLNAGPEREVYRYCKLTPNWAAPMNYGRCEYEISSGALG